MTRGTHRAPAFAPTIALVAAVAVLPGCGDAESKPDAAPDGSTLTVEDPVGDTEHVNGGRPSDVTVNVDLAEVTFAYDEAGLTVDVTYAEPLDPDQGDPAEILVRFRDPESTAILWWFDAAGRPYITGEDEIRTACRVPKADVDREAGQVTLVIPTTKHCLGTKPPGRLSPGIVSYSGSTWDRVDGDQEPVELS